MDKQLIIAVSREFGSGGHVIAEELAKRFDLPLYDSSLLRKIAEERDLNLKNLSRFDEVPKRRFLSRRVRGYDSSPEAAIAEMQFNYMKEMAENGDSFVIVGRCAETVLSDYDCMIPIFILGEMESRVKRIAFLHSLSDQDAEDLIEDMDRKRKEYHNYYCEVKWGDSRNYDISINSSALGISMTVDILETFIRKKIEIES